MNQSLKRIRTNKKKFAKKSRATYLQIQDKFNEFLISRFSDMKRGERLTFKHLERVLIEDVLTNQKKELLTKMLYRKEACMSWNFSEIEQVKSEVYSSIEIRTVLHQIWQVPEFQISRSLNDIVFIMIKKRLRNKMLEPCYNFYRNLWFLIKKKSWQILNFLMLLWKWIVLL